MKTRLSAGCLRISCSRAGSTRTNSGWARDSLKSGYSRRCFTSTTSESRMRKRCSKCRHAKILTSFPIGRGRGKRCAWCKTCHSQYDKDNRQRLNERLRDRRRRSGGADYCTPRCRFKHLSDAAARLAKRGIRSTLTFAQYLKIVAGGVCCYCTGALPKAGAGIDRKDSARGYSQRNCVSCCTSCNTMRGHDVITFDEMPYVIALLKRLRRVS